MQQFHVKVSFKNGDSITAWFNQFDVHRDPNNNQLIVGIQHQMSNGNESVPFLLIDNIVFIQVLDVREVEEAA